MLMYLTIGAVVISIIMIFLVSVIISRVLTDSLKTIIATLSKGANRLVNEAEGFAQTSSALADGAHEQETSLEETGSALDAITSMARKNADGSKEANALMNQNFQQVTEGSEALGRMSVAMDEINDSSAKISKIIKTIEDIAFQTNLLALNAAVEAACAGEAGKGFAVVADEVKTLAQRSAQASFDTAQLINNTIGKIKAGSESADEIEKKFTAISSTTTDIRRHIQSISDSTEEQAQGMGQISSAIAQIEKVTQQTSDNAAKCADASEEFNSEVENLQTSVATLEKVIASL